MKISDCCGAPCAGIEGCEETGICPDCKEHCEWVDDEEDEMNDKKPWDDEPTPLTDDEALDRMYFSDQGSLLTATTSEKSEYGDYVPVELARKLEQKLRHALKLVNSLRIDVMHVDGKREQLDPELVEQRLSAVEEVLTL